MPVRSSGEIHRRFLTELLMISAIVIKISQKNVHCIIVGTDY